MQVKAYVACQVQQKMPQRQVFEDGDSPLQSTLTVAQMCTWVSRVIKGCGAQLVQGRLMWQHNVPAALSTARFEELVVRF